MKVRFKRGNKQMYYQDFRVKTGMPIKVVFDAKRRGDGSYELRAPRYGGDPYGNGAIIIDVPKRNINT